MIDRKIHERSVNCSYNKVDWFRENIYNFYLGDYDKLLFKFRGLRFYGEKQSRLVVTL